MLRESLAAASRHVALLASTAGELSFRRRTDTGGTTRNTRTPRPAGMLWLRLEREGGTITASTSPDGASWSTLGRQAIDLPATVYVGAAVANGEPSAMTMASVSDIYLSGESPTLPSGWSSNDIGAAPRPGTASYSAPAFLVSSAAPGVGDASDAARFVYTRVRGDMDLVARLEGEVGESGRQAGLMLRQSLDAGAPQVSLLASDAGTALFSREVALLPVSGRRVTSRMPPVWLKLQRRGALVNAYHSTDGGSWTLAGSEPSPLTADLYVGLAVAAGPAGGTASAAFTHVSLMAVPANRAPLVSLTSPGASLSIGLGTSVALTATASDPDDRVARVDFLVNGVRIGSDATAPYAAPWTALLPGVYAVAAAARDDEGLTTVSPAVTVVVGTSLPGGDSGTLPRGPWKVEFEASVDHSLVDHYMVEVYFAATRTLAVAKNIGKPAMSSDRMCRVDVDTLFAALPGGSFEVVVRAVTSIGTGASAPAFFAK
jgi:regulation of enolase protein 1 (concanavalin A-like superfamily)